MTDSERVRLAERLRLAREKANLSQEEVAEKMSLPRPAISQIENGRRKVEALELARLAKLYKCSISYFADEPEDSSRFETLTRAAASLSEKDRDEVLRFAEFLRQKAHDARKQR